METLYLVMTAGAIWWQEGAAVTLIVAILLAL
jgi:hypothetical protein